MGVDVSMDGNVSDAVVVVVVGVVRRRDSREEAWDLVNNGTPRSVALKGGKVDGRVRNGVCVSECSLLSCERLYSDSPFVCLFSSPALGRRSEIIEVGGGW